MTQQGAALALSGCELFKGFSETGLAILATIAAERAVRTGTPLFVEGMASDAMYVVKRGSVHLTLKRANGQEAPLGTLGAGEALGQMALLQASGTRLVSAVASADTLVLELRARDFQRLQAQKPQACLKLMLAIAAQVGQAISASRELLLDALLPP
ncbi:MAG: cyclic nucleotide-binding domain-containing protein [Deltaproteobacteria bacterium]